MKNLFLLLTLFFSLAAQAQVVDANLHSDAQVSRFRRKVHPFKLGYCLGKDTEISNDTLSNIVNQNKTSGSAQRNENGGDKRIREFYFGNVDWDVDFSSDEVLKIHFLQNTIDHQDETTEMLCNTTTTKSTLLAMTTELKGSVLVTVPKNVFVLRIKKTNFNTNDAITNFTSKVEFVNRQVEAKQLNSLREQDDDFVYLFVRPGDLIRFSVDYNTDALTNVGFDASFEVGFLGSFRCSKLFDFNKADAFSNLLATFMSVPQTNEELDALMVKASCLQNPDVTRDLLMSSHGNILAELLRAINQNQSLANQKNWSDRSIDIYNQEMTYLSLDLSKNIVSDLRLFCDTTSLNTLFAIPSDFTVLTRKYHWASLNYVKIKYTLGRTTPPAVDVLLDFFNRQEKNNLTYADLKQSQYLDIIKSYATDVLSDDLTNFANISSIYKQMPNTVTDRTAHEAFLNNVNAAHQLAVDFQYQIQSIIRKIVAQDSSAISIELLTREWSQIKQLNSQLLQDIGQDLAWFAMTDSDPSTSQFSKDLYYLNSVVLLNSQRLQSAALRNSELYDAVVNHNPDYLPLLNFDHDRQLYNDINKCLDSAHD